VLAADPRYQCCTFRGGVTALDAETGKLLWQGHAIVQAPQQVRKNKLGIQLWGPSGAAIWSSPTIDPVRRMVYATTGDSYSDPAADTSDAFVAFEMETGKLAWFRQMTTGDTFNVGCEIAAPVNCPRVKGPDFDRVITDTCRVKERTARVDRRTEIGSGARNRSGSTGKGVVADARRARRQTGRYAMGFCRRC
jgi:outer membrane protein assembly factor BamB